MTRIVVVAVHSEARAWRAVISGAPCVQRRLSAIWVWGERAVPKRLGRHHLPLVASVQHLTEEALAGEFR